MRSGRPGVDHRRHALGDTIRVRRDAQRRDAVVHMDVNVNQAGRYIESRDVDDLLGQGGVDVGEFRITQVFQQRRSTKWLLDC